MADAPTYVGTYLRAIDSFNRGDLATFGEALAEDCTFEGVGHGRAEILKALQQGVSPMPSSGACSPGRAGGGSPCRPGRSSC